MAQGDVNERRDTSNGSCFTYEYAHRLMYYHRPLHMTADAGVVQTQLTWSAICI
jgi:hypothetical protein